MKRRRFIELSMASLAGCSKSQRKDVVAVKAGLFVVNVPVKWSKNAIIEKVPIKPLYSKEDWMTYQDNELRELKPAYICRPQHWAIRFPDALPSGIYFDRANTGDNPTAPQILIYKADEWSVAFTDGKHEKMKSADVLRSLRESMDGAMVHDDPRLSPAYMDASLAFMCLKRRIDFSGGHGIRLVAQWTIEPNLMRLGDLHYLFLGMSDDNSCQIIATFPLSLPGLPGSGVMSHLGRDTQNYVEFSKGYEGYTKDAKKWLEQHADEITPSIHSLDVMMQSLVARRWE